MSFDPIEGGLESYRKKPHNNTFDYVLTELIQKPPNIDRARKLDMSWMMSTVLFDNIPMWVGLNSLYLNDDLQKQNICYMKNISLPPTRLDVVLKTMQVSQDAARKSKEHYALVTYDLAIAIPAMAIQAQESPKFDNLFICFGAFHIQMA